MTFLNRFNLIDTRAPDGYRSWDDWSVQWFTQLLGAHRERLRQEDSDFVARLMVDVVSGVVHRIAAERPEALADPRVQEHTAT